MLWYWRRLSWAPASCDLDVRTWSSALEGASYRLHIKKMDKATVMSLLGLWTTILKPQVWHLAPEILFFGLRSDGWIWVPTSGQLVNQTTLPKHTTLCGPHISEEWSGHVSVYLQLLWVAHRQLHFKELLATRSCLRLQPNLTTGKILFIKCQNDNL